MKNFQKKKRRDTRFEEHLLNTKQNVPYVLPESVIGLPYVPKNLYIPDNTSKHSKNSSINTNIQSTSILSKNESQRKISNSKGNLLIDNSNYSYGDDYVKHSDDFTSLPNQTKKDNDHILKSKYLIGEPIPLPYMEVKRKRNVKQESRTKHATVKKNDPHFQAPTEKNTQDSKTRMKLKNFLSTASKTPLEKRLIEITIKASDENDIVRICDSILQQYRPQRPKTLIITLCYLILPIVIVLALIYYLQHIYKPN